MTGGFASIQAAYAAHRIATYPLTANKSPAVRYYDRIGLSYSAQLALKAPEADAAGFCAGPRSRLTIIDIDSTDDRLVDEIESRFGRSPLHVVTPSGGRHLYFRNRDERRHIRPFPDIDILGAGNVVAVGSRTAKGCYVIDRGSLNDLDRLPPLKATPPTLTRPEKVPKGTRSGTLFRWGLRIAPYFAGDFNALLAELQAINMNCRPPLSDDEVVGIARSAWHYETTGNNWVGRKARTTTDRDEVLAFGHDPEAFLLLKLLECSHPRADARFAVDQIETAKLFGWNRKRLRARIETLLGMGRLKRVHRGHGIGDPHLYVLSHSVSRFGTQCNKTPSSP